MNLDRFIESGHRCMWITEPGLEYYVRRSGLFPGVIELANVVSSGDGTRFGYWRFLKRYATRVPFIAEQVVNPALASLYERLGWSKRLIADVPQYASPLTVAMFAEDRRFRFLYLR